MGVVGVGVVGVVQVGALDAVGVVGVTNLIGAVGDFLNPPAGKHLVSIFKTGFGEVVMFFVCLYDTVDFL